LFVFSLAYVIFYVSVMAFLPVLQLGGYNNLSLYEKKLEDSSKHPSLFSTAENIITAYRGGVNGRIFIF